RLARPLRAVPPRRAARPRPPLHARGARRRRAARARHRRLLLRRLRGPARVGDEPVSPPAVDADAAADPHLGPRPRPRLARPRPAAPPQARQERRRGGAPGSLVRALVPEGAWAPRAPARLVRGLGS